MQKFISMLTACAVLAMLTPSPRAVAADSAQSGAAVAFAKVNLTDGTLRTFGGKGTKTATIDYSDNGCAKVRFDGKYSKNITEDKVVINATCESANYGVANAYVVSATSTQLIIGVCAWKSDTLSYQGDRVFFSVFVGQ
jgi:hypothetical protein